VEETVGLPTGFFGTPTIISWIGFVVIFLAIVALIWYWVASSKSEDKEEESL
jgi:protein-S-isoprenylcysteine O-methyltransferase Ste14